MSVQTNRFKIYSYPYLSEFSTDYKKGEFHIEGRAEYNNKDNTVILGVSYSIDNDYINQLIANGDVKVSVKISCKPLGYLKVIDLPSNENSLKYTINSLDVDGDVDLDAFLVTVNDIKLKDNSFSKDWEDEEPYVEKGNIIGESNTYVITINHYKDGGKQSIVSFTEVKSLDGEDYYEVELGGDRIVFRLPSKMYKHYTKVCNKNEETIITDFLIPEFTTILQQMIEKDDEDNSFNRHYKRKEWYKVISNKYEKELNKDPCAGELAPLTAAQLLLKAGTKKQNAVDKDLSFIVKMREGGAKDD